MDSTRGPDDDTSPLPLPPNIMSKSTNLSQSNAKFTDLESHRETGGPTLRERRSYATITRKDEHLDSAAGANPATASGQPARSEPHLTNNQTTVIPGETTRGHQAIIELGDVSQFGTELGARSRVDQPLSGQSEARNTQGVTISGPTLSASSMRMTLRDAPLSLPGSEETREREESPFAQVDTTSERAVNNPHAEQVHRAASVQPPAKPSTSSPPLLKRPSASRLPPAPALVKMASSRMHTSRGTLPYEPQAPPSGTSFESSHPLSEDKGKAHPDEQGRNDPSTAQYGPPAPSEHTPAATESSLLAKDLPATPPRPPASATIDLPPQERNPSSVTHGLPVSPTRIPAVTELPSRPDKEREGRLKDSANAEPNPTTGYAPDVLRYAKTPPESSAQQTYSSYGREYDSSAPHLSTASDSREKMAQSSNSAPLDDSNPAFSSANLWPYPQGLPDDSQTLVTFSAQPTPLDNEDGRAGQKEARTAYFVERRGQQPKAPPPKVPRPVKRPGFLRRCWRWLCDRCCCCCPFSSCSSAPPQ